MPNSNTDNVLPTDHSDEWHEEKIADVIPDQDGHPETIFERDRQFNNRAEQSEYNRRTYYSAPGYGL